MNIQEYSEKFLHISALLDLYFHLKRPKVMYLSTGKTSKNPRNSAYAYDMHDIKFNCIFEPFFGTII